MNRLINAAFDRTRTVTLLFLIVLGMGTAAYINIPKEAEPDIPIPMVYVSMTLDGISPEDAERLLLEPMEQELESIEGLAEMRATASEGFASVILEFGAGFDADRALDDVRERVDIAKSELPTDADEPRVEEVNVALFPVLTLALSGSVPERQLVNVARDLSGRIEGLPGVLEADIGGDREELLEVAVDNRVMQTYDISYSQLFERFRNNNLLVPAGALDTGAGRLNVKVPGVVETPADVASIPIKTDGDRVVTFDDIASIRPTFKDPDEFARVGGQPAVTIEVSKRVGANIIRTVDAVRGVVDKARGEWGGGIRVAYLLDKSQDIQRMLRDLQNNVLTAIVLVMVVVVAALGWRPALLVGLAIPGSFLAGILAIHAMGYTMNIVVLFSLILVTGMLVDGAIVVVELAERKLTEGWSPGAAYAFGARRMAWPITTGTATTLCVFLPLLVWPGVVGEFMKYLPITVLVTLGASLAMALVFIPVVGGVIARRGGVSPSQRRNLEAAETGDLTALTGASGTYVRGLATALRAPWLVFAVIMAVVAGSYAAYYGYGRGVEFFPEVEPERAQVRVLARGDLSVREKDSLVRAVEKRLLGFDGVRHVYARTLANARQGGGGQDLPEDTIGVIQLELQPWSERRPAAAIMADVREATHSLPGIRVAVRQPQNGPGQGKPVQIRVSASDNAMLEPAVERLRGLMDRVGGFVDVQDNRALPGVEWQVRVDRAKAARFGADVQLVGNAVQLVTNGILIGEYRPDYADEEVDIRVRFPLAQRSLATLGELRVPSEGGQVPIRNFVSLEPAPRTGTIERVDGERTLTVEADVADGALVDDKLTELRGAIATAELPKGVSLAFTGEDEERREAQSFLASAFLVALLLMALILVTQFNRLYQAVLVMAAIAFASAGVLLGLLVTQRPFGVVMGGVGMIALAGIVVNNNIVLIDTYNVLRRGGMEAREAILRTGAQRLRPVLLTSVTTVLGLMPMVLKLNVDIIGRNIEYNAPSTQWWAQLSSTIAGGLAFATVLTLVLTPCLLMIGERWAARRGGRVAEPDVRSD
jgi:multidrug efflux pump